MPRRRRHVERRVAVEEADGPQLEPARDDRHHGPVLEARHVVRAEDVPEHDIGVLERAIGRHHLVFGLRDVGRGLP